MNPKTYARKSPNKSTHPLVTVTAEQWFKNGDHSEDGGNSEVEGLRVRYYRHPGINGKQGCRKCKKLIEVHGFLDEKTGGCVCPGDYVLSHTDGTHTSLKPDMFNMMYVEYTTQV